MIIYGLLLLTDDDLWSHVWLFLELATRTDNSDFRIE